jgi:WD40 repeat protein
MVRVRFAFLISQRMSRLGVGLVLVLLTATGAAQGEDAKRPRTDLYGDPLPPGAVMRLGTIRLRHRHAQIAFSKDGKQLISCDDGGKVLVWDVVTGKPLCDKRLPWAGEAPGSVFLETLSPDGTTATGLDNRAPDDEHALSICDLKTAKERGKLPYLSSGGFNLVPTFSPDGKLLAIPMVSGARQIFCWEIWAVASLKKRQTLTNPAYALRSIVAFSPDGKRLAGLTDYEDGSGIAGKLLADLLLWETTSGKLLAKREKLTGTYADSLVFSPDGKTLALGGQKDVVVRFFSADTLTEKSRLKEPTHGSLHRVNQLVFSPDGRRFSAVYGKWNSNAEFESSVLVWELDGAKEPRQLPAHGRMQVAFSPDGKRLVCNDSGKIRLYDAASGRPLSQPPPHDGIVRTMAVSPDGKRIASRDELGVLNLWDTTTGKGLRISARRDLDISAFAFSADGKYIVAIGRARTEENRFLLQTWAAADGKALQQVEAKGGQGWLYAAEFSLDGKRVMTVFAELGEWDLPPAHMVVWDLFSGKRLQERTYKLQVRPSTEAKYPPTRQAHAAFAPGGEQLSVWLGDRVGLKEVSTGSLLAKLPKAVRSPLIFSSDGRLLVARIAPVNEDDPVAKSVEERSLIEVASGQEIFHLHLKTSSKIAFTPNGRGVVVSDHKNVCVWDTATGDKLYQMAWPESIVKATDDDGTSYVPCIVALPGGRVAASMTEGDILVWDLEASTWPNRKPSREFGRKERESLWSDLVGNARKAHHAIHVLTTIPIPTITLFQERFLPVTDDPRIEKLLADLDSDAFEAREAATRELTRLHYRAEPLLRRALENKPSLEIRRRIEAILAKPRLPSAEDLRALRVIAVLERIGTPEARGLLAKLAGGAASPETRAAQQALQRLKYR